MPRRTKEDIAEFAERVLARLKDAGPMRAEEMSEYFDIPSRDLEKPLKLLRREGRVTVEGAKRWTTYKASTKKTTLKYRIT